MLGKVFVKFLGCWVRLVRCWVRFLGCWVSLLRCWVMLGCWVRLLRCWVRFLGCWVMLLGCWVRLLRCWVRCLGCWVMLRCWVRLLGCWVRLSSTQCSRSCWVSHYSQMSQINWNLETTFFPSLLKSKLVPSNKSNKKKSFCILSFKIVVFYWLIVICIYLSRYLVTYLTDMLREFSSSSTWWFCQVLDSFPKM